MPSLEEGGSESVQHLVEVSSLVSTSRALHPKGEGRWWIEASRKPGRESDRWSDSECICFHEDLRSTRDRMPAMSDLAWGDWRRLDESDGDGFQVKESLS